jgi:hypothetical protein
VHSGSEEPSNKRLDPAGERSGLLARRSPAGSAAGPGAVPGSKILVVVQGFSESPLDGLVTPTHKRSSGSG